MLLVSFNIVLTRLTNFSYYFYIVYLSSTIFPMRYILLINLRYVSILLLGNVCTCYVNPFFCIVCCRWVQESLLGRPRYQKMHSTCWDKPVRIRQTVITLISWLTSTSVDAYPATVRFPLVLAAVEFLLSKHTYTLTQNELCSFLFLCAGLFPSWAR